MNRHLFMSAAWVLLNGCVTLHNTAIGDVARGGQKFEIAITDIGINVQRTTKAIGELAGKSEDMESLNKIIGLFQWGPRTGNPVYNIGAWSQLQQKILEKCPNGEVHSLVSNREFRDFYYGSAEGVRVTGYCLGAVR